MEIVIYLDDLIRRIPPTVFRLDSLFYLVFGVSSPFYFTTGIKD